MERDWVYLKIDELHMWVSLTLKKPEGEEHPVFTVDFIESYLRENGIKSGIDYEAIKALTEYVEYGREVIVARGKEAVNGHDGFYQFMVSLQDEKKKPKINSDGSVDYHNSLKLAMVKEGDLIALYVPPTNGEFGYTVFAEVIAPTKGKELRPLKGKGFNISEDGKEYRAAYEGRIYKQDEKIIVDKIYIVKKDLDITEGNVSFSGDVEVKGDVRSGLKIEAGGNVYIHGHVGSCQIISGGNVTIRKGIQGRGKCQIISKGDVAASFVEKCSIGAEGCVYADYLMDAVVASKQKVIITSKQGRIVGGNVFGMQGIVAKEAGNDTYIETQLSAGVMPEHIRSVNELKQKLKKLEKDIELLDKHMRICDSIEGSKRTKETEATRMKIIRAKVILTTDEKKIREQMEQLDGEIERAKREACVHITGTVFPRVRVSMGRGVYAVRDACKDVVFKLVNHNVVMRGAEEDDDN